MNDYAYILYTQFLALKCYGMRDSDNAQPSSQDASSDAPQKTLLDALQVEETVNPKKPTQSHENNLNKWSSYRHLCQFY